MSPAQKSCVSGQLRDCRVRVNLAIVGAITRWTRRQGNLERRWFYIDVDKAGRVLRPTPGSWVASDERHQSPRAAVSNVEAEGAG